MLVFLIPLKSATVSRNWSMVSKLVVRTIKSVLQQTDDNFRIYLVCNEMPIGLPIHDQLEVIQTDIIPTGNTSEAYMSDKWLKVRIGLCAMGDLPTFHLMILDADDCVSNKLAAFVNKNKESNGWYFDSGYFHDEGSKLVYYKRHRFDEMCGSSNITKVIPDDLPVTTAGSREDNHILRGGHTKIRQEMELLGRELKPLPFPGAVYILDTGDNDAGFSLSKWHSKKILLSKLINTRYLSRRLGSEFGLYGLDKQ